MNELAAIVLEGRAALVRGLAAVLATVVGARGASDRRSDAPFPGATVRLAPASALEARDEREPGVLAVVVAHHVDSGAAALEGLLADKRVASVGLLGPGPRAAKVLALVGSRRRLTLPQRGRLRAPMGLDPGAEGPAAIALSVLAEAQATVNGRPAAPLSQPRGASGSAGR